MPAVASGRFPESLKIFLNLINMTSRLICQWMFNRGVDIPCESIGMKQQRRKEPEMTKKACLTLVLAVAVMITGSLWADKTLVNVDANGLALQGYDAVAFHTQGKAVKGSPDYTATFDGATYRFSSAANKAQFEANPSAYAPAYGGYCGYGVGAANKLFPVEIDTWQIVDGRLILNLNPDIKKKFDADRDNLIRKADANWPGLVHANGR